MRSTVLILILAFASSARAQSPLDDARLGTAASELHKLVDRAAQEGLPSELVLNKVREGLAKNVPPPRISGVARGLVEALEKARSEAQPFYPQAAPPPGLLKALVEAHAANVSADAAAVVMRAGGRERAIQVLTDLVQRGYPAPPAARTVAALSGAPGRERALDQLVGQAERLRSVDGASAGEALDAIARANADGSGIGAAERFLHSAAGDDGRGPNRETSGARGPRSGGPAAPPHGKGHP